MLRVTLLPPPPERPADGHKGTFGRVLLIAGSAGMSGAAVLAGRGALRGGAGLVFVASPAGIVPIVAAAEPSYLTIPLAECGSGWDASTPDASALDPSALEQLRPRLEAMSSVAIGPGCGRSPGFQTLCAMLFRELPLPLVVDADGLNVLAEGGVDLTDHAGPRIFTPHPGEFARLTGQSPLSSAAAREAAAAEFAGRHELIVVLKGRGTVVTDGECLYVNTTGNSGLATGGSGDVLTGLIAALAAQGLTAFDAAQLGVWMHGRAADLAVADRSQPGLIASDLPDALCRVWRELGE